MSDPISKNNLFWGLILVIIGVLFILDNFYIIDFGDLVFTFWPLILIAIGLKIIFDKRRTSRSSEKTDFTGSGIATDSDIRSSSGILSESNVFGDINLKIESGDFDGGSVNNVFGDVRIDISAIKLKKNMTKVYVSGVFGDVTIVLPMNIAHKVKTSCVAGDLKIYENRRDGLLPTLEYQDPSYSEASNKLYLQASVVFGSVNIIAQ